MGTRAIVMKKGKPWVATHRDGYPEDPGLGTTLCESQTKKAISKHGLIHDTAKNGPLDMSDIFWANYVYDIRGKEIYYASVDMDWEHYNKNNESIQIGKKKMKQHPFKWRKLCDVK